MDKDEVKRRLTALIESYKTEASKRHNEEATKTDFILPLFRTLGWHTEDSNEVSKEENISGKRVDYGFRIDGIPKFFLEAKGLDESLDDARKVKGRDVTYAEQAINYAYYKGCNWAILTNFKEIRVYDAWAKVNPNASFRFAIRIDTLLSDFDSGTYLLSKEAFQRNLLDEKYGMKSRKRPITEQLLLDFTAFRGILSKDVYNLNKSKKLTEEELDEAIQRLFDRLIFIRNCEDRELEEYRLLSALRQWKGNERGSLLEKLREIFTYFDETYNGKIFSKHLCDQVEISDNKLGEVLNGLYTTENGSIQYDFSLIDADILGNIYEQYLGHILKKTKLTESKAKRKSEGIYYTPSYIVEYITKNTVGEFIRGKKANVEGIKVLDLACGSGSFLIKTFDILDDFHKKKESYNQNRLDLSGAGTTYSTKLNILKDNIFGVDLDKQAVDIAQLNLLLKIAEKKKRLPILQQNIKNGNSLIDDSNIAGEKAFNWDSEFGEIMKDGGFDVIIGNPPYVRNTELPSTDKAFYSKFYKSTEKQYDLYILFIERALSLMKTDGLFGYIIPNKILSADYGIKLREIILENCEILKITDVSDLPVFKDAATYPIILILRKRKPRTTSAVEVKICKEEKDIYGNQKYEIKQNKFKESDNYQFLIHADEDTSDLLEKIEAKSTTLGTIFDVRKGIETGNDKERTFISENKPSVEAAVPVLGANTVRRYFVDWNKRYVIYNPKKLNGARKAEYFERKKFVTGRTVKRLSFAFDEKNFYTLDTTQILFTDKNIDYFGVLGLINSKLVNFYYTIKFKDSHMQGGYIRCYTNYLERIPIIKDLSSLSEIGVLAKKIVQKHEKLLTFNGKKLDGSNAIEKEIEEADAKIDQLVYKLYGITDVEKKMIEDSIK